MEIRENLESSAVGIFILTKENLDSVWMHFEAGAISSLKQSVKVCPLVFGMDQEQLSGPISQFQATPFVKSEWKKLIRTINVQLGDSRINESNLDVTFDKWWPDLEHAVEKIIQDDFGRVSTKSRSTNDILEEVLNITKSMSQKINADGFFKIQGMADVQLIEYILRNLSDIIFANYTGEEFAKKQISALKAVKADLDFFLVDTDKTDNIMLRFEQNIRRLEKRLLEMQAQKKVKQPESDDDIPF